VDYLSLHGEYGTKEDFLELVSKAKELGLKVIVDMCFNHCGDVTEFNKNWFVLYKGHHTNYTGCGNTFNAHNPIFIEYALQSLYWLVDMGVDGFRFDLAPLMMINSKGECVYEESLLERIDVELADYFRAYEPWSLDGYFKSKFDNTGYEWNDILRDGIRNHVLGKTSLRKVVNEMNAYDGNINFSSCHDGFSNWDWMSYEKKDNYSNGEDNRDGNSNEICGIVENKEKMIRRALTLAILAKGIPMLRSYEEFGITLYGNNNNYKKSVYQNTVDFSEHIRVMNKVKRNIDYNYEIEAFGEDKLVFKTKNGDTAILVI
jgi:glycogen operon protein